MTDRIRILEGKIAVLKSAKRKYYLSLGVLIALMAFAVGILIFSLVDLLTSTPEGTRFALLSGMLFLSLVLLTRLGVAPVVKALKQIYLAHEIERKFPSLEHSLITAIEYGSDPAKQEQFSSREMVEALVRKTEERIREFNFLDCVKWKKLRNSLVMFAGIIALFVAYLFAVPDSQTAVARTVKPWDDITYTRVLSVSGDIETEEHSDVEIELGLGGRLPEQVLINVQAPRDEWHTQEMAEVDSSGSDFRFSLKNIAGDMAYYIEAGDAMTGLFTITAFAVPRIETLRLTMEYPEYTELPTQELDTGAIAALRGTIVTVHAGTNTALEKAYLEFDGGTQVPLDINAKQLTASFTISENSSYRFRLVDTKGRTNKLPVAYPVTALPDERPDVRIVQPTHDLQLIGTAEVPVNIDVSDDYGITEIGIVVNVKMQTGEKQVVQTFDTRTTFAGVEHTVFLEDFLLESHDLVSFYAYAIDNDTVTGSKRAISKVYFVEILPYEEIYREMAGSGMKMMPKLDVLKKLITVQRGIIARTFPLLNEITDPIVDDIRYEIEDLAALQNTNADEAAEYALTLEQELLDAGMEAELGRIDGITAAAEDMYKAVELLNALDVESATQPEQRALANLYQALTDLEKMVSREGQQPGEQEKIRQALELADQKAQEKSRERREEQQRELEEKKEELEQLKEEQEELNSKMEGAAQEQSGSPAGGVEAKSEGSGQGQGQGEGEGKGEGQGQGQGKGEGRGKGQGRGSSPGEMSTTQAELAARARTLADELSDMGKEDPNLSSKAARETEGAAEKMESAKEDLNKPDLAHAAEEGAKAEEHLDNALNEIARAENRNLQEALDTLARETADAARDQAGIDRRASEESTAEPLRKLATDQEELIQRTDKLAGEAKAIQPEVAEVSKSSAQSVGKASDILGSGAIQGGMRGAADSLVAGNPRTTPSSQVQEQLAEAARHLEEAARDLAKSDKEKLLDAIRAAKDAVERQNALNREIESMKETAESSGDAKEPDLANIGREQTSTREDSEELTEMVKQLREGGEFIPSLRPFTAATDEMKNAEGSLSRGSLPGALDSGIEAGKNLHAGLRELKSLYDKQLLDDLDEAIRQARQAGKEQEKLIEATGAARRDESMQRRLALKQKWIGEDLANLGKDVEALVEASDTVQSDARERLRNAEGVLTSAELTQSLDDSRMRIEGGDFPGAIEKETVVSGRIDEAADELERAYRIISTSEMTRLWELSEKLKAAEEQAEMMKEAAEGDEEVSREDKESLNNALSDIEQDLNDTDSSKEAKAQIKKASETMETLLIPGSEVDTETEEDEKDKIKFVYTQIKAAENDVVKQLNVLIRAQRIVFPKDEACPPEYEKLVEYYYKVLSEF